MAQKVITFHLLPPRESRGCSSSCSDADQGLQQSSTGSHAVHSSQQEIQLLSIWCWTGTAGCTEEGEPGAARWCSSCLHSCGGSRHQDRGPQQPPGSCREAKREAAAAGEEAGAGEGRAAHQRSSGALFLLYEIEAYLFCVDPIL